MCRLPISLRGQIPVPHIPAHSLGMDTGVLPPGCCRTKSPLDLAVFDFYNVLTAPGNHHRWSDGKVQYVYDAGGDTLYYALLDTEKHAQLTPVAAYCSSLLIRQPAMNQPSGSLWTYMPLGPR